MKPYIIALGHKARQGKDTFADLLEDCFRRYRELRAWRIARLGFANDLKAWCRVQGYMETKDSHVLQQMGEFFRETVAEDFWVQLVEHQIVDLQPEVVIISDMRHKCEMEWVKSQGGLTVELVRQYRDGVRYLDSSRAPGHISEIALDGMPYDYHVTNIENNLQGLALDAQTIFEKILLRLQS